MHMLSHAGGALRQHRNLDIPFAAQVLLRTNPAKSSKLFRARSAQAPRKATRLYQGNFCIKPLLHRTCQSKPSTTLSSRVCVCTSLSLSVHKPCNSHHNTPTKPYSTPCWRACNITAQDKFINAQVFTKCGWCQFSRKPGARHLFIALDGHFT